MAHSLDLPAEGTLDSGDLDGANAALQVEIDNGGTAILGTATGRDAAGGAGTGIHGSSDVGPGVLGTSTGSNGVQGSTSAPAGQSGVWGVSSAGSVGVTGTSAGGDGVQGYAAAANRSGVFGTNSATGFGVTGFGVTGDGVWGTTNATDKSGVRGENSGGGNGVTGTSNTGTGVQGTTSTQGVSIVSGVAGVHGHNTGEGGGVLGTSQNGAGVEAFGYETGVRAQSQTGAAIEAYGPPEGEGLSAMGRIGVMADGGPTGCGLIASGSGGGKAATFNGAVDFNGPISKPGGTFRIDHPLDPANRYLNHSFVESSEMKNVYDGVVTLGPDGQAEVELPDWFEALNEDFRYQLTPIGEAAPNLYVSRELEHGAFGIAGGAPNRKVSWQVTGVRKDAWARANPVQVETEKTDSERGLYLYPEAHGAPDEKGLSWHHFQERQRHMEKWGKAKPSC